MKKILLSLSLILVLLFSQGFAYAQQTGAGKITGLYWSPKKDAKIEIYKKRGIIFWQKQFGLQHPVRNINNPNESLRKRDVVGIELLTNFTYDDGAYTDGKIYDPESGKTYSLQNEFEW